MAVVHKSLDSVNRASRVTRRYFPVGLSLLVGVGFSVAAAAIAWKWEMTRIGARLQQKSDTLAFTLQRNIDEYVQVTRALGAFYDASDEVTRQDFKEFSQPFLERYAPIRGMAWAAPVLDNQRNAYEKAVRASGVPNFSIIESYTPEKRQAAGRRPEYFPIVYGEPFEIYGKLLGLNLRTNPKFLPGMEKARDTGGLVASERMVLALSRERGVALYRPVYRKGMAKDTLKARRQSFLGIAYTIYALSDMVEASLKKLNLENLDFYLIDKSASLNNRFLVFYNSRTGQLVDDSDWQKQVEMVMGAVCVWQPSHCTRSLSVGDRKWSLIIVPTSQFEGTHWLSLAILAIGLLFTTMLAIYLCMSIRRTEELKEAMKQLQLTQAQLVQAEKMSSLGQLVAGVAHEINNPINFISGNLAFAAQYTSNLLSLVQLYSQQYPNPTREIQDLAKAIDLDFLQQDLYKILDSMKGGAVRIQNIVESLRTFSHIDEADMKSVNIHEGIDSTLMLLQNRLNDRKFAIADRAGHSGVKVIKEYGNLPNVECYAGKLNQVFMYILTNAIDALEEATDKAENSDYMPTITIGTEFLEEKSRVAIRIRDNGIGMTKEVLSQIFNPFFTTKPVGKGTGLGLSISYQIIVEKHTGELQCFSEGSKGAEFCIEIPIRQSPKEK